jgi:hypothetical protein
VQAVELLLANSAHAATGGEEHVANSASIPPRPRRRPRGWRISGGDSGGGHAGEQASAPRGPAGDVRHAELPHQPAAPKAQAAAWRPSVRHLATSGASSSGAADAGARRGVAE